MEIGSAFPHENEGSMTIKGRNTIDGLPKDVTITAEEVRNALASPLAAIIDGVLDTLEKTPPELAADIYRHGVYLTGGASQVNHLAEHLANGTGLKVNVATEAVTSVAMGLAKILNDDNYKSVAYAIEGMSR